MACIREVSTAHRTACAYAIREVSTAHRVARVGSYLCVCRTHAQYLVDPCQHTGALLPTRPLPHVRCRHCMSWSQNVQGVAGSAAGARRQLAAPTSCSDSSTCSLLPSPATPHPTSLPRSPSACVAHRGHATDGRDQDVLKDRDLVS
eukprot:2504927-Rhodomonas_salina.2